MTLESVGQIRLVAASIAAKVHFGATKIWRHKLRIVAGTANNTFYSLTRQ